MAPFSGARGFFGVPEGGAVPPEFVGLSRIGGWNPLPHRSAAIGLRVALVAVPPPDLTNIYNWRTAWQENRQVAQLLSPIDPQPLAELPLEPEGAGGAQLLECQPVAGRKGLFLLRYVAGEVGTTERFGIERTALLYVGQGTSKPVVLADARSAVHPAGKSAGAAVGGQPQWQWLADRVLIREDADAPPQVVVLPDGV